MLEVVGENSAQLFHNLRIPIRLTVRQERAEQFRGNSRPTLHKIAGQTGTELFVALLEHGLKELLGVENAPQREVGQERTDVLLDYGRRTQRQLVQQGHEQPDINRAAGFVWRRNRR